MENQSGQFNPRPNNKSAVWFVIALTVFIVLIIGLGVYAWQQVASQRSQNINLSASVEKEYTSRKYGFKITVPAGWEVQETEADKRQNAGLLFISPSTRIQHEANVKKCKDKDFCGDSRSWDISFTIQKEGESSRFLKGDSTTLIINGKTWKRIEYEDSDYVITEYGLERKNMFFIFTPSGIGSETELKKILDGFQWI